MEISPAVGRSSPAIIRSRVVFPEPEEPSSTRNSPSRIERSTPSTACRSPNCFLKFRISMPATDGALAPRLPAVRGRVGRLGEVYRRVVDDTRRGLWHLERPQQLRRRGRRGPGPAGAAAAGCHHKQHATPPDVHRLPLATARPDRWGRRPTAHHARANREKSRHREPAAIPRSSTAPPPTSSTVLNPGLQRVPRPFRPPISPFQGRDV